MLYSVIIPLGLLVVPWLLVRFVFATEQTRRLPYLPGAVYLWAAAALWVLAMHLPNIPISPDTDTFTMHSLGCAVAGVLFLYAIKVYGIPFAHTWQFWVSLFLFASGLGVLNELLEFALDESGLMPMPNTDTWWDLVANTLGAFFSVALLRIVSSATKK